MRFFFQPAIRHPLFADLTATPATQARGRVTAIAGTFAELARSHAQPRRAVFVLARLTECEREELWRKFQVPVFTLLLDSGNAPVAWECEAQNGLHVGVNGAAPAGIREDSPCPCGRPGSRVMLGNAVAA